MPGLAVVLALAGCTPDVEPPRDETSTSTSPSPSAPPTPRESAAAAPGSGRSVTLAFAGDVHFEGGVASLLDDPDATLGPLGDALASADIGVVNLESSLTTGGTPADKELEDADNRYWFRSPPAALELLDRSGVDVVSMANNHGADYGAAGLRDSLEAAEDADVDVIGIGDGRDQAFRPSVTKVGGTDVAVLAADASTLESEASIWDVGRSGPGIARAGSRLVTAVKQAAKANDVVAVYLHWGRENVGCPTAGQLDLASDLAAAGADVVVGAHAHQPQGAGLLGDTYVSYGLGNFLWYHGNQADTGVLRVTLRDGAVVDDAWVPGEIPEEGGQPRALSGSDRTDAVKDWEDLRGCTNLAPVLAQPKAPAADDADADDAKAALPAYASSVRRLPAALRDRMDDSSHTSSRCPVDLADLRLLLLTYVGYDGKAHGGQLVVHSDHASDVVAVFRELYRERFPIRRMQLVDDYAGDDDRSMAANNTSAFNCRNVAGQSSFSAHAYGAAVDLNPVENPYVTPGDVAPDAGREFVEIDRSAGADAPRGAIVADDVVVRAFARVVWSWGGTWNDPDFQHFFVA
ncbi:CapA family protein [Microlunatus antarcticus]|uniref:Poly-gamma-glutamate synthesis protein (Capsule biosynthesis protein) n=1 Tax=Microlunatus antarcticus TaxID=53388 RepID=A0A7W5JVE6_9ACTN|nr:poly-gamma-glutamate synthesis protein (capsule biosynthesis protein) [Microlunatus antarcticus]